MQINSINNYHNPSFGNIVRNNIPQALLKKPANLYIISGPSGVGKDTVLNAFNDKFKFFTKVVTSTTRQPRVGEIDGVSYNFISPADFKKGINENGFLEYINIYGDTFYGTRASDVENLLKAGKNPVLVIDVDGAKAIKSKLDDVIAIFIKPNSIDTLKEHLLKRGTEDAEKINTRLQRAKYEIEMGNNPKIYDAIIQNNSDIQENVNDLTKLLKLK